MRLAPHPLNEAWLFEVRDTVMVAVPVRPRGGRTC